ncbi:class III signal peptide-containing protein [Methanocaldococcus indicus]|uniref:class III signal peptide-containing protein n=1 Tax=Methanocaldococcus indicus TaxID=213231 RepID=UPI003C6CC62E
MRAQLSLELSILILAFLVIILLTSGYIGIYGLNKVSKISVMGMSNAALSKIKNGVELVSSADVNTTISIKVRCPPGYIESKGKELLYFRNDTLKYTISTNCSVNVELSENPYVVNEPRILNFVITKINDTTVKIDITS